MAVRPIGIERMLRLYFLQQWFNRHCQVARFGRAAACEHDDIAKPLSRLPVPPAVIEHAVWLYHCFSLSLRDVELILEAPGASFPRGR